jgi:hypothetical protein
MFPIDHKHLLAGKRNQIVIDFADSAITISFLAGEAPRGPGPPR